MPAPGRAQLMSSVLGAYINTMVRFRAGAAYAISTRTNFRGGAPPTCRSPWTSSRADPMIGA